MLRRLPLTLAVAATLAVPAAAGAAPTAGPAIPLTAQPSHVVGARDGGVWVSTSGTIGQDVLHVGADGTVTPFDLPGDGTTGITFGPGGDAGRPVAGQVEG